jgi:hypothetical protein
MPAGSEAREVGAGLDHQKSDTPEEGSIQGEPRDKDTRPAPLFSPCRFCRPFTHGWRTDGERTRRSAPPPCACFRSEARLVEVMSSSSEAEAVIRWNAGLLLLLVGVLSTPGLRLSPTQRSHCAAHPASPLHLIQGGSNHPGPASSVPSWFAPAHSDCSHCPPSDCASVAPCSISTLSAAVSTAAVLKAPATHLVHPHRVRTAAQSTSQQPPTPPPQSVA